MEKLQERIKTIGRGKRKDLKVAFRAKFERAEPDWGVRLTKKTKKKEKGGGEIFISYTRRLADGGGLFCQLYYLRGNEEKRCGPRRWLNDLYLLSRSKKNLVAGKNQGLTGPGPWGKQN